MSDNPPFTAVADEPLEARIVAWVLGDASAFEAAELEHLCETRPELLVFRRRMRALHGLLTEAEAAQPDLSWKLPPEKRRVLDEIFGAPELAPLTANAKAGKSRRRFFWRPAAVAACLVGLLVAGVFFGAGSLSMKSPRLAYEKLAYKKEFSAPNGVERFETLTIDQDSSPVAAAGGRGDKRASLGIEYPPELIEGTPKPIRLPNLPGADGELYYQRSASAHSSRRGGLLAARDTTDDRQSESAAADKKSIAGSPARPAKPSAPSSSMDKVIAANTAEGPATAVPEQKPVNQPSTDFGDGDDFGGGWGREVDGKPATTSKPTRTIDSRLAGREKASQPAKNQPGSGIVVGGIATNEKIGGRLTTLKALELKSGNLALRDRDADGFAQPGESTFHYARSNEPPPPGAPAAPPQPAGGAIPTLGDSPALGRLFESSGSIEAKDAARDASHAVAKLESEPADVNFDMAKSLRGPQPATDEPAGTDRNFFKDSDTRSREGELGVPPPAIESRPNFALQSQEQAQKAGVAGGSDNPTTETVSGDLERDLSVPLAEREMLRRRSAEAASDRLLTEDRFGYTNGKSGDAAEKMKAAKELLPDDSLREESEKFIADHETLAEAAHAELSKQSGDRPDNGREITDDGIRRNLSTADGPLKLGKDAQAKADDEKVLETNPAKSPARHGLAPTTIAEYTTERIADDETGTELLKKVDKYWEMGLPDEGPGTKPKRKPGTPPPPVDPGTELSAEADPYSTFSLSISDASFKTAQAALAKGEAPDPAGIRVEQFYNAMDYGDPSPSSGEPVAAMIEQSAHPLVPGRNLVRVALRTAATGRSASQPLRLTLLIDQSGSMARDDRRQALGRALGELATLLTPNDRLTVVGFSLKPRLLADDLPGDQAGKLLGMINQDANEGGTNLELALSLAKQLAAARKQTGAQNRIVLFTDGAANLGNADPERLAETVTAMRQTGLSFDVAGIGTSELNDRLLAELARHGNGRFYVVDAATDEPNAFARQLAGAFRPAAENVKVQVRFNPRRVGGYKLIGFEEHRLNKEDFHNDTVDAAELAAEEAGVALYQVQPLPSGSGDLGEVSVRFRDTTTGLMVERSWSIPYDPAAPAFDQANPSLQLAGLAMLTAEKLRNGPIAAAIDFTRFTDSRATVRNFYPEVRRVRELLEMINIMR